jgi:hypothetical protein
MPNHASPRARAAVRLARLGAFLLALALPAAARAQAPQISELSPASVVTNSGDLTLTIRGTGFSDRSRVQFNGAQVPVVRRSAGELVARVENRFFSQDPFITPSDLASGAKTVTVIVIDGPASDDPMAVRIFKVLRQGAAAEPAPLPAPVLTGVGPNPAPPGGTLVITGDHLDAPQLHVNLIAKDPAARISSWGRDRFITARTKQRVEVSLAGIPAGSYDVRIEAMDAAGRTLGSFLAPAVVGAPTRLGAPAIAQVGPTPYYTTATALSISGANFADDARVTLVPASGRAVELARAPNRTQSQTLLSVALPGGLYPGDYTLRVENPGTGTPAAEQRLAFVHPGQPAAARQADPRGGAGRPERPRPGAVQYRTAILKLVRSIGVERPLCLVPAGDHDGAEVRLRPCREGGDLFRIAAGQVRTRGDRCLDWGTRGGPIHLAPCREGNRSQVWYFHGNGLIQNALQDAICMDVEGESNEPGARIIAWDCKDYRQPARNQTFALGESMPVARLGMGGIGLQQLTNALTGSRVDGFAKLSNGYYVVSAGGANVVSAGGANVVAAGGLNVIAVGGGNVVSAGGMNVVAAGGLNVIAPGGANVVSAGGLNVINNPAPLFQGARVVAAGGLN